MNDEELVPRIADGRDFYARATEERENHCAADPEPFFLRRILSVHQLLIEDFLFGIFCK